MFALFKQNLVLLVFSKILKSMQKQQIKLPKNVNIV